MNGMSKDDIITAMIETAKILDAQDIPTEGRIMRYLGKDGNIYEVSSDKPLPDEFVKQIPDALREALHEKN